MVFLLLGGIVVTTKDIKILTLSRSPSMPSPTSGPSFTSIDAKMQRNLRLLCHELHKKEYSRIFCDSSFVLLCAGGRVSSAECPNNEWILQQWNVEQRNLGRVQELLPQNSKVIFLFSSLVRLHSVAKNEFCKKQERIPWLMFLPMGNSISTLCSQRRYYNRGLSQH